MLMATLEVLLESAQKEFPIGLKLSHYKGRKYKVLGHCIHTELEEVHILYSAIDDGKLVGMIWARPLKMFHDRLEGGALKFVKHLPN